MGRIEAGVGQGLKPSFRISRTLAEVGLQPVKDIMKMQVRRNMYKSPTRKAIYYILHEWEAANAEEKKK